MPVATPRTRRTRLRDVSAVLVSAAIGTAALSACQTAAISSAHRPTPESSSPGSKARVTPSDDPATASFTDSGVAVTLRLGPWHEGSSVLTALFAPVRPGFHLYSTALPPNGVDGVGRPTAVHVSGALASSGRLTAHARIQQLVVAGTATPVPVYADGPVSATLVVRRKGVGPAALHVSYAACSLSEGCLFPVSDHVVRLTVTSGRDVTNEQS